MKRIIYYKTLKSYIYKWTYNYNDFDNPIVDNYNKYLRGIYLNEVLNQGEIPPNSNLFEYGEVQAEKYIKEISLDDANNIEYPQFKYLKIK